MAERTAVTTAVEVIVAPVSWSISPPFFVRSRSLPCPTELARDATPLSLGLDATAPRPEVSLESVMEMPVHLRSLSTPTITVMLPWLPVTTVSTT